MAPTLIFDQTKADLRLLLQNVLPNDLPCATVVLVNSASELFHYEASPRTAQTNYVQSDRDTNSIPDSTEESHADDIYWLASCTKLVTAIACMQLVEQGRLSLDDGDQLERLCPELKDIGVLQADGSLASKDNKITLRMLLTHTAGFGYSFLNEKLKRHGQGTNSVEFDEFSGLIKDFIQPLVNQPGQQFEYGISMDWAGIVVERLTRMKLNDYMRQYIFEPLRIKDLSFVPSLDMKSRMAGFWHRDAEGKLSRRCYPLSTPLSHGQNPDLFQSGGAGLFGCVRDFSKILTALLNNGTSPITGNTILLPETVAMMFLNQLPESPDFARRSLPAIKPDLVYPATELYPLCPDSKPQGWGLSFMISPSITGRSPSTAHWSGLSNVFWWCDRENGVAGIVASQVLPFVDPKVAALWVEIEKCLYDGVQRG